MIQATVNNPSYTAIDLSYRLRASDSFPAKQTSFPHANVPCIIAPMSRAALYLCGSFAVGYTAVLPPQLLAEGI